MTSELESKVEKAIKFLKAVKLGCNHEFSPPELAYSGGKDSDVILELARMAHIELFFPIYKNTTIDPPGTIKHVLEKGVKIRHPEHNFLWLISKYGFPTRRWRFCCSYLKEYQIEKHVILGIRACESRQRKARYIEPQQCRVDKKRKIDQRQYFPILDWTNDNVAEFVETRNIKCHPLYYDEQGHFHPERRLGCMGCPLASTKKRIESFKTYPNMVKLYIKGGRNTLIITKTRYLEKMSMECFVIICSAILWKNIIQDLREKHHYLMMELIVNTI